MNSQLLYFLLKLKNAAIYKKEIVTITYKPNYLLFLNLLYSEGYIQSFSVVYDANEGKKIIIIYLRFYNNFFALSHLKLLSKQSCIRTVKYKQLSCNIYDVRKTFFITTSQGLKTQIECKQKQLGGSLVFMC